MSQSNGNSNGHSNGHANGNGSANGVKAVNEMASYLEDRNRTSQET